jgi:cysteine desulfurase
VFVLKVYLDNSATTKPYEEVVEVMSAAMRNRYGNPSALHKMGIEAENDIKSCKKAILKTLNNPDGEIIFTSGGTESNNLAILGTARRLNKRKDHIITSKTEHKSVLEAFKTLEEEGYSVTWLSVDDKGLVDPIAVINAVTEQTALISLMMVNNETGIIQPVEQIAKELKKLKNPPIFHVDAVQAYGKVKIDLKRTGIDLLTGSGHKIHGPKGIGFLYIRKGIQLKPLIFGGGQQLDIRPGTENTFGIIGLEAAVLKTFEDFVVKNESMGQLRDFLRTEIQRLVPEVITNTPIDADVAPHILHLSFPDIRGEVLLHALETDGVYVAIGSACNSKIKKYSHVLEAMRLSTSHKEGAVRFSLSSETSKSDIDYAVEKIVKNYKLLHNIIKGR